MSETEQSNQSPTVTVPRRAVWWWTVLLVAPWVLLAMTLGPQWVRECAQNWHIGKRNGKERIQYCRPGPWGDLEYTRIAIEPPEGFVVSSFEPERKTQWTLRGYTPQMLEQLWTEANLSAADQQALMATARWENGIGTVVLEPSRDLVLKLTTDARARIYKALAVFSENQAHVNPCRFRADRVDEWFADSGISDRTEQLIRRMLYPRGTSIMFSDWDTLAPMLGTDAERARALKTLARMSTLLVKLRVRPNTDIEGVARYWGRGRRSKDITPLLLSLPKLPEGYTVDVAHLLPPFARRRLYTYPNPDSDPDAPRRDCHWTSLNFFSETPDDRFLSSDYVRDSIVKDYYPTFGEPLLGDLVFLMKPNGQAFHSCVYVADNIVFTKNGSQSYMPWQLMELGDVCALYSTDPPLETRIFRYRHW